MQAIEVREFEERDRLAVIELWRACGLLRSSNDPNLDIARNRAVDDAAFFIATLDSEVIGSVMAGYDGHRGWINYLAVHPQQQGAGSGSLLMERAEQHLEQAGCPKINLQVRTDNSVAIEFYARLGFTVDHVVSMGKRLINDAPVDAPLPAQEVPDLSRSVPQQGEHRTQPEELH